MKSVKIALLSLLVAAPVSALEPISKEAHINKTLLQGFIADKIADNCPSMAPRKMRALTELLKLRDYALKQGYDEATVRNFVESKTEKARGKAEADAWLKQAGAVQGKPETYCAIGREQIAKNTLIGYLLRDRG